MHHMAVDKKKTKIFRKCQKVAKMAKNPQKFRTTNRHHKAGAINLSKSRRKSQKVAKKAEKEEFFGKLKP